MIDISNIAKVVNKMVEEMTKHAAEHAKKPDPARLKALHAQLKILEKHKADLIAHFRKQEAELEKKIAAVRKALPKA